MQQSSPANAPPPRTGPLLAVFIDGLRPDSVARMPFVSSLAKPVRMQTELGYSITCHPSMYTGVWPEQHLSWFIWQRDPQNSPFRWMKESGWDHLPNSNYLKVPLWKLTHQFKKNSAWFSVPFPAYTPLRDWPLFDVSEKKFWDEDGFNPHFPTIFELLRGQGISTQLHGMNKQASQSAVHLSRATPQFADFTYLFFGDIDSVSHRHCQDSPEAHARLLEVDRAIERWYRAAQREHGEPTFLLWSDHGHISVERKVKVRDVFRAHKVDLNDFQHIVDSNYLRLWFRNDAERAKAERVVQDLGPGFVIDPETAARHHVRMPDNRYGDMIYYLEAPAVFDKGDFTVFGRTISAKDDRSMHGYSPDHAAVDATLVSNRSISLPRKPILQDIPPTILRHFGLKVPPHMVGAPLW